MLKRVKIFLDFLYENLMRIFKDFISNLFCYDILENIESKILSEEDLKSYIQRESGVCWFCINQYERNNSKTRLWNTNKSVKGIKRFLNE